MRLFAKTAETVYLKCLNKILLMHQQLNNQPTEEYFKTDISLKAGGI